MGRGPTSLPTPAWLGALALSLAPVPCPGPGAAETLATVVVSQALPAPGELRGRVSGRPPRRPFPSAGEGAQGAPLPHTWVELRQGSRRFLAVADQEGHYRVAPLPPGVWAVRVSQVGYEELTIEVVVPQGETVILDLELRPRPIPLPAVAVAVPVAKRAEREIPLPWEEALEVRFRGMEGSPGVVESGLAGRAGAATGSEPADPRDVLLVRGSAADLKLVLLDGAPLYTPFHMAGLLESFDPHALGRASLFLGGAPARFDGGLSYILDLHGRKPRRDALSGQAGADLLSARAWLEGPLTSSTSLLMGGRSLHNLGAPVLGKGVSPYRYREGLVRGVWEGTSGSEAYLTAFWNREEVRLGGISSGGEPAREPGGESRETVAGEGGETARWGNRALAAGWRLSWDETSLDVRAAATAYEAALPVGRGPSSRSTEGRSGRFRIMAELSRPWSEGGVWVGGSLERAVSRYRRFSLGSGAPGSEPARADPGVRQEGITGGVFVETLLPLTAVTRLRLGVRGDGFSGDETPFRLAPRVALTWLLAPEASLSVAAGRYHQFLSPPEEDLGGVPETGGAGPGPRPSRTAALRIGRADHLVLSLEQTPTPGVRIGLDGFVKEFHGAPSPGHGPLRASGVDVRASRQGERVQAWLGYALSWFWEAEPPGAGEEAPFTGRHLLSAGISAEWGRRTTLTLSAGYGHGLPYTAVPLFEDPDAPSPGRRKEMAVAGDRLLNEAPPVGARSDEGFLRLDGELSARWSPAWGGRRTELRTYLRVVNALKRRDALFYALRATGPGGGPEPLAALPLLPLLGVEWRF